MARVKVAGPDGGERPVQLDRADKHIRTDRVKGFVRAGAHRDEQVAVVGAGQVTAPAA